MDPQLVHPRNTVCADFQTRAAHHSPGSQPGKVVVTMRQGQNNIVIIPLSR